MKTFKFADTSVFLHEKDLPGLLDHNNEIGIDTETTGLNLSRDRLCLIQIEFLQTNVTWLNLEKSEVTDESKYKNLKSLLKNNNIKKIFHYARFEFSRHKSFFKLIAKIFFAPK